MGVCMTGEEFKRIRLKLKLSASALGHALGYEGSDANIARTIYRLEAGRPIPRSIGRLLEMFDAFGVPRAWAGETAQRQHAKQPQWSGPRPKQATHEAGLKAVAAIARKFHEEKAAGQQAIGFVAPRPVQTPPEAAKPKPPSGHQAIAPAVPKPQLSDYDRTAVEEAARCRQEETERQARNAKKPTPFERAVARSKSGAWS